MGESAAPDTPETRDANLEILRTGALSVVKELGCENNAGLPETPDLTPKEKLGGSEPREVGGTVTPALGPRVSGPERRVRLRHSFGESGDAYGPTLELRVPRAERRAPGFERCCSSGGR